MNLMNQISVNLISISSADVIKTAVWDGQGISFDDSDIANYRLIEQNKKNHFELWILFCDGDFRCYEGELSEEAQRVANALFDVAWVKEFEEIEEEEVYQEDRFGVPVETLRYEKKYPKMDKIKTAYVVDPSVPF